MSFKYRGSFASFNTMSAAKQIYSTYIDVIRAIGSTYEAAGTRLPLPIFEKSAIENLLNETNHVHASKRTYIDVSGSFTVVGDLNGNIHALFQIFKTYGIPPQSRYIFLGNIVDFGEFSLEVATLLMAIKVLYPNFIYILKGTNEESLIYHFRGLKADLVGSYGTTDLYDKFIETFSNFPRAAIINGDILCCQTTFMHGHKNFIESVDNFSNREKIDFKTYLHLLSEVNATDELNVNDYARYSGFDVILLGNFEDSYSLKEYEKAIAVSSCNYDSYGCIIVVDDTQACGIEEFKICTAVSRDKAIFYKHKIEINRSHTTMTKKLIRPCPANLSLAHAFQSHVMKSECKPKW